jgi:AcrR family transcriptional regulator
MASANVRQRILDHAERLFAERGYHGTSLREVARACEVRQSHVQYHFGSKEALFRAVFERRVLPMNQERLERLAATARKPPDARQVVRAVVEPLVLLSRQGRGGARLYPQLVAHIINDPQGHARRVSREFNDPVARATIASLRRAVPGLSEGDLAWCYLFAVGAMVTSVAGTGRVRQLSGRAVDDAERILSLLVPFVAGGLKAVAAERLRAKTGRKAS